AMFLWSTCVWQNSIRQLMEMDPVAYAYPCRISAIALGVAVLLISLARGLRLVWQAIHRRINRVVPRRVSYVVSTIFVMLALVLLTHKLVFRLALNMADAAFLELDQLIEDDIEQPQDPLATGSPTSLVSWDSIGRMG